MVPSSRHILRRTARPLVARASRRLFPSRPPVALLSYPHPGPSLLVWSLNSQGAALTRVERDKPHIVTLQEPNFTPAQAEQFLIRLSLKKYRAWHHPGSCQGTNRGGLLVAVRDDIRASLCHQSVGEFGHLNTLNLEAWMLTVVWRRPAQTQLKQCFGRTPLHRP